MKNPIGIISMQFTRPFTNAALPLLARTRALGFDFIELLVPEPDDDLDPAELRRICADQGLEIVLAARVNLQRSIAGEDAAARQGGLDYLEYCVEMADRLGAPAILTDFSRLVIDPNRGEDDPTLLMRLYDGTVIPANRDADAAERERRLAALHRPYHAAISAEIDRMAASGKECWHMLDLLLPQSACDNSGAASGPGLSARRANRAALRLKLLEKYGSALGLNSAALSPPDHAGKCRVLVSPEALARMEERHILLSDVEEAVVGAEASGHWFENLENGHRLGSWRPRKVTFWVEYQPQGVAFMLHDAWCHRMVVPGSGGQEAVEKKVLVEQAGGGEGRGGGAGAGQRDDAAAGFAHGGDDAGAGVGDARGAGVGNQRDGFAGLQFFNNADGRFVLVVLVRRQSAGPGAELLEQGAAVPGVFGRHPGHAAQDFLGAAGEVGQVPERGRDDIQCGAFLRHGFRHSLGMRTKADDTTTARGREAEGRAAAYLARRLLSAYSPSSRPASCPNRSSACTSTSSRGPFPRFCPSSNWAVLSSAVAIPKTVGSSPSA